MEKMTASSKMQKVVCPSIILAQTGTSSHSISYPSPPLLLLPPSAHQTHPTNSS